MFKIYMSCRSCLRLPLTKQIAPHQHRRARAAEPLPNEVVKRSIHIPQPSPTAHPVERDLNISIATHVQVPAATEIDHHAILSLNRRHTVVLNLLDVLREQLSIREQ